MSEISERLAAEHKRVWNRLNLTCLCGWETTDPPIGDRRPFIAHVTDVTEAAVRETIAADIEASPVDHGMDHLTTKRHCARIAKGES